jgi:hypothetical protein
MKITSYVYTDVEGSQIMMWISTLCVSRKILIVTYDDTSN